MVIRKAFDYWQKATNFIFTEIKEFTQEPDIKIDFTELINFLILFQ